MCVPASPDLKDHLLIRIQIIVNGRVPQNSKELRQIGTLEQRHQYGTSQDVGTGMEHKRTTPQRSQMVEDYEYQLIRNAFSLFDL